MRIFNVFFWIIVGAALLWFFTLNLGEHVTVNVYNHVFDNVPLVTVIFITLFVGVVIGALLLSTQVIKSKSENSRLKKDNKKLSKELEGLRNLSIDEIPDTNTQIDPGKEKNDEE